MSLRITGNSSLGLLALSAVIVFGPLCNAQMFSGSQRPFVTGIIPVIGPNGEVGGVSIDAEGFVSRADLDRTGQLTHVQLKPMGPVSGQPVRQPSKLRKISLRRLQQELVRLREKSLPVPGEIEFLAGLQRIEYLFVDPESNDIILAGPAEGWRLGTHGFVVGESSGLPVIDLCDLVMMVRNASNGTGRTITCSIDASPKGMANYSTYMYKTDRQFNEQTLQEMMEAIGNFDVTFSGVSGNSHFARILVAADVMMKRLAMNLEPSPIRGVTSYVQMLQKAPYRSSRNVSPRWWLTSDYDSLLRDDEGLVWRIQGPAVKTMTSDSYLNRNGEREEVPESNLLAQRWANEFTKHYRTLSVELPIFGQLRNCMDLAIVGALLNKYDLFKKAGFEPDVFLDDNQVKLAEYPVPRHTQPQISYAPGQQHWIVTLSGGVGIEAGLVTSVFEIDNSLTGLHRQVVESPGENWWWD